MTGMSWETTPFGRQSQEIRYEGLAPDRRMLRLIRNTQAMWEGSTS